MTPPSEYLLNCNIDGKFINANAGLLAYAQYLETVVDQCNEKINRIKQWAKDSNG